MSDLGPGRREAARGARHDAGWHTETAAANFLQPSAKRHCGVLSIAVSAAVLGAPSNFIIGADQTRRCLIASCCVRNVIAKRIGKA